MEPNDLELLRRFSEDGSDEAFRELVNRHLGMVYAVARRHVENPDLAEEVAHAVFIALARKAGTLSGRVVLAGWLYRATRFASGKLLRDEERRARREKEAAMTHISNLSTEEETGSQLDLSPLVFDVLDVLSGKDRDVILLRFMQDRSFAEVAMAMGTSEAAAKMRAARALEKLRKLLEKRGAKLTLASLSAGLASASGAVSTPALTTSICAAALGQAGGALSAASLAGSVVSFLNWGKVKIAAMIFGLLMGAGALVAVVGGVKHDSGALQASPDDIVQRKGWIIVGRNAVPAFHQGQKAVSFAPQAEPGLVWRDGFIFSEGVIEADIAAFNGHIGLAFWIQDSQNYSAVYFRPQNRPEHPINGPRGVQYVALPEYGWERLRQEKGGAYENFATLPAPDSGAWFHVRLEIAAAQVKAFIDYSKEPCLVINDVLTSHRTGSVGFFMGNGSLGIISNLKVQPAQKR